MIYSPSRLKCFENCPKAFEFKYIQRVKVPERVSIESFMGKIVHAVLEKLFVDLQHTKNDSLEELLLHYEKLWKKDWSNEIVIHKDGLTQAHYFELGKKCVRNFFEAHQPFDQWKVLGIEQKAVVDLDGTGKYKLRGFIDLLAQTNKNQFQIHDYKTFARLPEQTQIDQDQQLAIYQLWVQNQFPEAKQIDLIWHYLVFQREGHSHRTKTQLEQLKKHLIGLINQIENTKHFETKPSGLCNYCAYKPQCPAWKHSEQLKHPNAQLFDVNEGVQLADQYAKFCQEKQAFNEYTENKLEELRAKIFGYAKQFGYEIIQGTNQKLKLKTTEKNRFPCKGTPEREALEKLIKTHNRWAQFSELDTTKLNHELENNEIDPKTAKEVKKYIEKIETKTIYISKINK